MGCDEQRVAIQAQYVSAKDRFMNFQEWANWIKTFEKDIPALLDALDSETKRADESEAYYSDLLKHAHEKAATAIAGYKRQRARTESLEEQLRNTEERCYYCKYYNVTDPDVQRCNGVPCVEFAENWEYDEARFLVKREGLGMERLTKTHKDGFGICNFDNQYGNKKCEKMTKSCYYCDRMVEMLTKLAVYEDAEEQGRLVVLPDTLICPYELNERFWICGWDAADRTFTIQERKKAQEADAALAKATISHD